jgi:threonylcarbamoyladenosine tRNA methylthiotransferase MtaB
MNRRYSTSGYSKAIELLRKHFNYATFTTDVIVGFPGETDIDFEETKTYVGNISFLDLHVFKYSIRKGTKAANMNGQVNGDIKHLRSQKLIALGKKTKDINLQANLGRITTVLIEEKLIHNDKTYYAGYTDNYIRTLILSNNKILEMNTLVEVNMKAIDNDFILAVPIDKKLKES